jgi:serine/threonine protein kinase
MAVVYKAHQPSLNRYVAIKVLPPQFAFDEQFVKRFLREARGAAALHHPNIVTIHDINQQDGLYFIVMEYIQGETLDELLRRGPLPLPRIARIVSQVADALEHAHQQGLMHRDIKPSNVMVDEQRNDHVTLMDFGLVRAAEGTGLTKTGMIVGTPEYMSPEQGQGEAVDNRTDIYSLGVVIFKMLTGQVPFSRSTPHAVLIAHMTQDPPSISDISPSVPEAVEAVVCKAMAKERGARYAQAGELARDLATAATGQMPAGLKAARRARAVAPPSPEPVPVGADATVARPRPTEKAPRKGLLWGLGALGAILLLGVCGVIAVFALNIIPSTPASPASSATPVLSATPAEGEGVEMAQTPTPTPSPKATQTPTPRPTRSPKATSTVASSPTPSPTASSTPTPRSAAPSPTNTPRPGCSVNVVEPENGAQFNSGQQVTFHWTGSQPGEGEYYEVRVDGASTGAAWFNSGLQQWEATWQAQTGGHTWQVFLMASDRRTARCSSPTRQLNVVGGGGGGEGPAPEPTRE